MVPFSEERLRFVEATPDWPSAGSERERRSKRSLRQLWCARSEEEIGDRSLLRRSLCRRLRTELEARRRATLRRKGNRRKRKLL